MRKFFASVLEILEIAVVAIVAVFVIKSFLILPFIVSGSSMTPTFLNGNYVVVDELTYRFRAPERGEVVVFKYPADPSTYFIKRIIGLPNERVVIRGNAIEVFNTKKPEGVTLAETYLSQRFITSNGAQEFSLKSDEYLVLGDNRSASFDSRSWGPLKRKNVIGLVRLRLWPVGEFRAFAAPQY